MNNYRKLLINGLNEILKKGLIGLDDKENEAGHTFTIVEDQDSVVMWSDIGFEELRVSVWWKYDHKKHPQADGIDNSKEQFRTTTPLAIRIHYPKFIGVACSGWLERKEGKYLQGTGARGIFDTYTRRGEKLELERLRPPKPLGYAAEGRVL